MPEDPQRVERAQLAEISGDLTAAEIERLSYLADARTEAVVVIAENGRPLLMCVPNPSDFALHKLWISRSSNRKPVKAARDRAQAIAVARLCVDYLGLSFESPVGRLFPSEVVAEMRSLIHSDASADPGFGAEDSGRAGPMVG